MSNQNINFTPDELRSLKIKISANKATAEEYEQLDSFLATANSQGFIKKILAQMGFNDYKSFVDSRSLLTKENLSRMNESFAVGNITGAIDGLINYLTSKN